MRNNALLSSLTSLNHWLAITATSTTVAFEVPTGMRLCAIDFAGSLAGGANAATADAYVSPSGAGWVQGVTPTWGSFRLEVAANSTGASGNKFIMLPIPAPFTSRLFLYQAATGAAQPFTLFTTLYFV